MSDKPDVMEVEDVAVFEVLNNPLRFRILRRLETPTSIRQVADQLGVPPTRLYYHFGLLEEAGVIEVVETRKVGAMLQKLYRSTAKSFRPSPKISQGQHEPDAVADVTVGVVLDGARADAQEALSAHFERLRAGDGETGLLGTLSRSMAYMSRERAEEFEEKLKTLMDEFAEDEDQGDMEFGLTVVFFPLAGSGNASA